MIPHAVLTPVAVATLSLAVLQPVWRQPNVDHVGS